LLCAHKVLLFCPSRRIFFPLIFIAACSVDFTLQSSSLRVSHAFPSIYNPFTLETHHTHPGNNIAARAMAGTRETQSKKLLSERLGFDNRPDFIRWFHDERASKECFDEFKLDLFGLQSDEFIRKLDDEELETEKSPTRSEV